MRNVTMGLVLAVFVAQFGCGPAVHSARVGQARDADRLTVGSVQREVRKGMSGGEVAEALGSPNIVSTDEKGREVWIYDKVSTEVAYSESAAFGTILILSAGSSSGAASRTQKTLTIIIKFDEAHRVRDFAYHASQF